jgi:peroxiredoxin
MTRPTTTMHGPSSTTVKKDQILTIHRVSGLRLPALSLISTAGGVCDLGELSHALLIFAPFVLPQDESLQPPWEIEAQAIMGLEALLAFARLHEQFDSRNIQLFGITTQSPTIQKLSAESLSLPFPLLSDSRRTLSQQLHLPVTSGGRVPRNRSIVIEVREGSVAYVWDPLASSGQCAEVILRHLANDAGDD